MMRKWIFFFKQKAFHMTISLANEWKRQKTVKNCEMINSEPSISISSVWKHAGHKSSLPLSQWWCIWNSATIYAVPSAAHHTMVLRWKVAGIWIHLGFSIIRWKALTIWIYSINVVPCFDGLAMEHPDSANTHELFHSTMVYYGKSPNLKHQGVFILRWSFNGKARQIGYPLCIVMVLPWKSATDGCSKLTSTRWWSRLLYK